jgi:hypothetical protein
MKKLDIICKGQVIYTDLTHEEAADTLLDLADDYYEGRSINSPDDYEIREVKSNGNA